MGDEPEKVTNQAVLGKRAMACLVSQNPKSRRRHAREKGIHETADYKLEHRAFDLPFKVQRQYQQRYHEQNVSYIKPQRAHN